VNLRVRRQEKVDHCNSSEPTGPVRAPNAAHIKEVLITLRDRLQAQVANGDDHEPVMARALLGNIRDQLEQINKALARIEDGKYGTCAICMRSIAPDRLVVRPYSTLCLDCQHRQDQRRLAR
jgi:RNA polymerase-binding transcription factor DksA